MTKDRWILVAILASCAVAGAIEPHLPHAGQPFNEVGLAHNIVLIVLVFMWVRANAETRKITPPAGAAVFAALFSPLGIPYYFFRSLPWRQAALKCLQAIGFTVIGVAIALGATLASQAIAI